MVFDKIKEIVSEYADVDPEKITLESSLEDLGMDSLDVVDLFMNIEDEFNIELPEDEMENLKTLGDLVEYVEAHN